LANTKIHRNATRSRFSTVSQAMTIVLFDVATFSPVQRQLVRQEMSSTNKP
jgi:hypothetical protein